VFERSYLVNTGNVVADGGLGCGSWLSESGLFLTDGSSLAIGDSYGATSGEWYAVKGGPSFTIENTARHDDFGLVRGTQKVVNELTGKADSQIAKGSSGTFSIWCRNSATGTFERRVRTGNRIRGL